MGETGGVAHRGKEGGAADVGDAGEAAHEFGGIGPPVAGFSFGGMGGEPAPDGTSAPDLDGDLGGRIAEFDCRMTGSARRLRFAIPSRHGGRPTAARGPPLLSQSGA